MEPVLWSVRILCILTSFSGVKAAHEFSNICSSSSEQEEDGSSSQKATMFLREILNTCFDSYPLQLPNPWRICTAGQLNCRNIQQVFNIVPSCEYCSKSESNKSCYISLAKTAMCAVNHYILPQMTCKSTQNEKTVKNCKAVLDPTPHLHEEDSSVNTPTRHTSEQAEDSLYGFTEKSRYGYKDKDCPTCDCPRHEELSGLSVGASVGLLFLGIVIGVVVTAVLCICVPSLNRGANNIREKVSDKITNSGLNTQERPHRSVPSRSADENDHRVLPSAPPPATSQARYNTLSSVNNTKDPHMYTGLTSSEDNEPMGDGLTYTQPDSKPIKGKNTVVSPVYNEFTDNIIPASANSKHQQQPIENSDTNETYSHDYFILEAEDEAANSGREKQTNYRPVSDHEYFVLEEQNDK